MSFKSELKLLMDKYNVVFDITKHGTQVEFMANYGTPEVEIVFLDYDADAEMMEPVELKLR